MDVGAGPVAVAMAIPARPRYLVLLRAACAHLAPVLGCTLAETADLGLAVNEASGFLLRNCITPARGDRDPDADPDTDTVAGPSLDPGPAQLTVRFVVDETSLHVTLEMAAEVFIPPDSGEFGWAILTALVDYCSWWVEGTTARVELRKRRVAGKKV